MINRPRSSHVLWIAAAVVVLAVQAMPVHAQPAATSWPMSGQNAQRTGEGLRPGPRHGDLQWVAGTGGCSDIVVGETAIYGSTSSELRAYDFDGSLKWRYPCAGCPAIDGSGVLYFGIDAGGGTAFNAIDPNLSTATIDPLTKTLSGAVKWAYVTGGSLQNNAAIAADGSIYITGGNGALRKFAPNGTLMWTYTLPGGAANSPAISPDGATVYAASGDGGLCAIALNGKLKWKTKLGHLARDVAIDDSGVVYLVTYTLTLNAIGPEGKSKWSKSVGGHGQWDYGWLAPAVDNVNKTVYCSGTDGWFHAFGFNGTLKWKLPAVVSSVKPAIGSGGTVYACWGGVLHAISPAGTILWNANTGGDSSPTIDFDTTGGNGLLYAGGAGLHTFQDGASACPNVLYIRTDVNPIPADQAWKLGAMEVTAGESAIAKVEFYYFNGEGTRVSLGVNDAGPSNASNWIIDLPAYTLEPGAYTVYAVATDMSGATSNIVSVKVAQQ
jgi:hypothetical protein